ncbi:GvpL/GvpF family gas vesicle protein [Myxococcaceae bacterium GXIMD 01537]
MPTEEEERIDSALPQYVYGIIRAVSGLSFGPIGLGTFPSEVGTVQHGGLAAVVSAGPSGVPDPTRDNLLAHERVNETVMREHTVLPLAFGTVFPSREDVEALLLAGQAAFRAALARVEGRVEMGLKVFDLSREGAAVRPRTERDAASLVEALCPVADEARVSDPIGERMLLNASFLVARERVAAFDARVRSLAAHSGEWTFRATGPWPPYHFVDIHLGLEPMAG